MALDEAVVEKRRKNLPKLWALVEAFRGKYKGALHSNWGAPFSVRTRVKEGTLEIDFAEKEILLRLKGLRLPDGVSFTTNRKFFAGPYPKKIGQAGVALGWDVHHDEEDEGGQDETTIRPDREQSVIGPETTCTAFRLSTADGRRFPGFARAADAEDLAQGRIDLLAALDPRGAWRVVMAPGSWTMEAGQGATPMADDGRWPLEGMSVLPKEQASNEAEFPIELPKTKSRRGA